MKQNFSIKRVLFIDIETAPQFPDYSSLPEALRPHWDKKTEKIRRFNTEDEEQDPAKLYTMRAGIYSEFAKVICITLGIISKKNGRQSLRLKSIYGDNEKDILIGFIELLDRYYPDTTNSWVCGHNIKEFDIPFLCRRMIIHRLPLPQLLQISGRKPWELHYLLDTLDMWKFGDYKNYTSLNLLAAILDIPSPKDDIDGSQVGQVYWEEGDIQRIVRYCEKDVRTVARVFLRISGLPDLSLEEEE